MMKRAWITLSAVAGAIASLPSVMAHCPLCTAATGAAVGAARFYGVDDSLVGVLIGGFVVSSALWMNKAVVKKRGEGFFGQGCAFILAAAIMTVASFKWGGLFSGPALFGIPRLLSGMLVGTVAASVGFGIHEWARQASGGKNVIPLQGASILLASLLIANASLILWGVID